MCLQVIFTENKFKIRFGCLLVPIQPPKTHQKHVLQRLGAVMEASWAVLDRLEIVWGRFYFVFKFRFDFLSFGGRFGYRFGVPNGARGCRLYFQDLPLGRSKTVLIRSFFRLAAWVRFSDPLGLLLEPSWTVLGSLGTVFGHSGGLKSWPRAP